MGRRLFQNYPCLLIDIFLAFCLITVLQLHRVFNECVANCTLSSISVLVAMMWSVYDIKIVRF